MITNTSVQNKDQDKCIWLGQNRTVCKVSTYSIVSMYASYVTNRVLLVLQQNWKMCQLILDLEPVKFLLKSSASVACNVSVCVCLWYSDNNTLILNSLVVFSDNLKFDDPDLMIATRFW